MTAKQDPQALDNLAPDTDAPSATLLAIRNGLKLGASLVFTWGIALGMRLLIPRYLGPSRFGTLNFADGFTAAAFIVLNLGADAYIRKEVAVRPSHASDFFGGSFLLRSLMTAAIFVVMAIILQTSGRSSEVQQVVYLYGVAQFFVTANTTLSALLHAKGRVGAMSILAVATKVVWAVGILLAMATGAGLWAYAASYLVSEASETGILYRLAQKHLGLSFRIDRAATKAMLVSSLPYFVNLFATTAYGKLDISLLEFTANSEEVGYYGSAAAVAGLATLITPLIGWVMTPMVARAAARDRAEFDEQIRRSMELILTVAIPASLGINLGAEFLIHVIPGDAYLPAVHALRILAVMFVLTYVAIIYATSLVMLERAWVLTKISLAGLVVNVLLNLAFIGPSLRFFGPGGGGTGCAAAMLGTEIFVVGAMMFVSERAAFDRRSWIVVGKSLGAYAFVAGVHVALAPLGYWRLVVDGVLYLAIVMATRALRLKEMLGAIKAAMKNREGVKEASA